MKISKKCALVLLFALFVITGVTSPMNIFQSDFQKQWQELFSDTEKLNTYTSTHQPELKNVKVVDYDLEGAFFNGATFENIEWENITVEYSKYRKTKFKKCKFINCKFWFAEFTDVVFEDCEFINSTFLQSKVINTRIVNCKAIESEFDGLEGTELFINSSEFKERSSFTDSKIPLKFQDTTLSGVNMMGMTGMFPLSIEGGTLDEVNFGNSHFSDVVLRRVKQSGGGVKFNDLTAKSISFEDVDMTKGTAIARSDVGVVRISGGRFGTSFGGSKVGRIVARDAQLSYMGFAEATLPYVEIAKCSLYDTGMWDGYIKEFVVTNSQFTIIDGENFKADIVLWDNVSLDGKIDLTNAQVKDFRLSRLTRGPNLQLITTGSNMRFN